MLRNSAYAIVFLLLVAAAPVMPADTLIINNVAAGSGGDEPTRGMSTASVESRWGAPTQRSAPVGNPPISRWDYGNFIVYFEYDHVIHAVARHAE